MYRLIILTGIILLFGCTKESSIEKREQDGIENLANNINEVKGHKENKELPFKINAIKKILNLNDKASDTPLN
ncbi:hypothetical protein ACQKND_20255 [Viridibacillus arvi]|uniref:hypothetical protein n=1 Tax=Viridibacillus arvi TaxID=263475 RepID=UPI003D079A2D